MLRIKQKGTGPLPCPAHLPPEFHALFLGSSMSESCAYFREKGASLEQAQQAKHDHLARKLRLRPYLRLLDIGVGWGAFLVHACRSYGVTGYGITPSPERAEYANRWIEREGLEGQAWVDCGDFRNLPGAGLYDRVTAHGWSGSPGYRGLPAYLGSIHRLLAEEGLLLHQGAGRVREGHSEPASAWSDPRIFPEGLAPSLATVVHQLEDNDFEVQDVENFRVHFARTSAAWADRLRRNREHALEQVDEPTYRGWLLDLAMRSLWYEEARATLYQVLATKRRGSFSPVPPTREDLYG